MMYSASPVTSDIMVQRYDMIPIEYLQENILEIGAGNQLIQLHSKHEYFFNSDRYLGIDLFPPSEDGRIIYGDILDIRFPRNSFNCVICFEVLEHIDFRHWKEIFEKVKFWLRPGGLFTFSTPYNESCRETGGITPHKVFGIKESSFDGFVDNLITRTFASDNLWGIKGEFVLRRILRGLKRKMTNHEFVKHNLYCQWRKVE